MESKSRRKRKLNRLGRCDICKSADAIYTCPRCETVSCSLGCVKAHKNQLDCDGIRVRTKFVPLDKMNEHSLLSDYRLLEDISRCVEYAETHRRSFEIAQPCVVETITETDSKLQPLMKNEVIEKDKTPLSHGTKEQPIQGKPPSQCNSDSNDGQKRVPFGNRKRFNKKEMLIARANKARNQILKKNQFQNESTGPTTSQTENKPGKEVEASLPAVVNTVPSPDETVPEDNADKSEEKSSVDDTSTREERFQKRNKIRKGQLLKTMRRGGNGKETALETLRKVAMSRTIILNILPPRFQKHFENTSFFLQKEKCIYWHIKVSFLNANVYTLSLNLCAETMTLENAIKGCLKRSRHRSVKMRVKDPLEAYRAAGMSKINVLMAADGLPSSQNKFYELDKSKTLRENFVGKYIVEYPHFCVVLEDCYDAGSAKFETTRNYFELGKEEESEVEDEDREKRKRNKHRKPRNKFEGDSDRESGEISDSADESESDDAEVFKESQFRSIYSDLLQSLNKS